MSVLNIISSLNRLTLHPIKCAVSRTITTNSPLNFRATPCLMAEPLKKKKRLDPAIIRARDDRRRKKLEKQIRRLEKNARQLKPIEECEVSLQILDEREKRERSLPALSVETLEDRALLEKDWARYKLKQRMNDIKMLDRIQYAQQRALDELRNESEELYQEAIQIDWQLLPFKSEGPAETPPIEKYEVPDGDYHDLSKKWE